MEMVDPHQINECALNTRSYKKAQKSAREPILEFNQ